MPVPVVTQHVTAAEITRNFGAWQDRASQSPIVVTHHGRARCVLLSADAYKAMSTDVAGGVHVDDDTAIGHSLLSERIDDGFLALDGDLKIREVNSFAAMLLGRSRDLLEGQSLADILPALSGSTFELQLRQTARSGGDGMFVIADANGRRLNARAFPWPGGVALMVRPDKTDEEAARASAEASALREAIAIHGSVGTALLNVRGTITKVDPNFAKILGFSPERLKGVRLTDLLTLKQRATVSDAVEKVLSGQGPSVLTSEFLVNRGDEQAARVTLVPVTDGFAVSGAIIVLTTDVRSKHRDASI